MGRIRPAGPPCVGYVGRYVAKPTQPGQRALVRTSGSHRAPAVHGGGAAVRPPVMDLWQGFALRDRRGLVSRLGKVRGSWTHQTALAVELSGGRRSAVRWRCGPAREAMGSRPLALGGERRMELRDDGSSPVTHTEEEIEAAWELTVAKKTEKKAGGAL
jgi:hypothetical protein